MDAAVAVAFLTKLKLIFETDAAGTPQSDKFLSFPNGTSLMSKDTFAEMTPARNPKGEVGALLRAADFANQVNFVAIPGELAAPAPEKLGAVYRRALALCQPAKSKRTATQEKTLKAALTYLNNEIKNEKGEKVTRLDNYQRYKDAYQQALTAYKNGAIAAQMAQGEGAAELQRQWNEQEPVLRAAQDQALLNWETKGLRTEVESKQGTALKLLSASPAQTIADLATDYDLLAHVTALDPQGAEVPYLPTQFSPANFFEDTTPWQTLTLNKAEIGGLLGKAPAKLQQLFDISSTRNLENLTVEYVVVELQRSWFHYDDFLLQRFWRLPETEAVLSDQQGRGQLPAFPHKLILVRNVKVTSWTTPAIAVPPPSGPAWRLGPELFANVRPRVALELQDKAATLGKLSNGRVMKPMTPPILREPSVPPTSFVHEATPVAVHRASPIKIHQATPVPAGGILGV